MHEAQGSLEVEFCVQLVLPSPCRVPYLRHSFKSCTLPPSLLFQRTGKSPELGRKQREGDDKGDGRDCPELEADTWLQVSEVEEQRGETGVGY